MTPLSTPRILDVTIRDGSNLINHQFSTNHIKQIIESLGQAGLEYAEVGHGLGIGARMMGHPGRVDDGELLEAAKEAAPDLNLSIFIQCAEFSLPLIPGLADFISQGRVAYSKEKPDLTEKIVNKLKKFNKLASVQLIQAHLFTPEEISRAAKQAEGMGADVVYLVDSFGSFMPEDISKYLKAIQGSCKLPIGFHGHNNFGLALSNSLLAWQEGAAWLDASVLGLGRGAGNSALESLLVALELKNAKTSISVEKICQATQEVILPIFTSPPMAHFIDLLSAKYKIIFEPPALLELTAASLHLHLDQLFAVLQKKMGKGGSLTSAQMMEILKGEGYPVEPLMESLD